jgi:hypothetical protein
VIIATDYKPRRISWFSCGAASAVATKLSNPDLIAYCETGSEHKDNARFMADCEKWFGQTITKLRNARYSSTWEVWEHKQYISGIAGAPCTKELKVKPRLEFQKPDDVHIFGYTADGPDIRRAEGLKEHYPDLKVEFPLIERGINKAACIAMVQNSGIEPPIVYSQGFPNANCIPCCKATSPRYWAMVRHHYPEDFDRMSQLAQKYDVKLTRLDGERDYIHNIPANHPMTEVIAPECDFLCSLAEQELTT